MGIRLARFAGGRQIDRAAESRAVGTRNARAGGLSTSNGLEVELADPMPGRGQGVIKLVGNLVVIVAGVLIALSAEAWWQDREERDRELSYLLALQADMAEAGPVLARSIQADSANAVANQVWARTLRSGPPAGESDSAGPRGPTLTFQEASVPTGTLNALLETGDIRLIQSALLRADIIALDALLDTSLAWRRTLEAQILENVREVIREMEVARTTIRDSGDPQVTSEYISGIISHITMLQNRIVLHRTLWRSVEELGTALADELAERSR